MFRTVDQNFPVLFLNRFPFTGFKFQNGEEPKYSRKVCRGYCTIGTSIPFIASKTETIDYLKSELPIYIEMSEDVPSLPQVRFADETATFIASINVDTSAYLFPDKSVHLTKQVLGHGSFGEVLVGIWRNCQVSCKRLQSTIHQIDSVTKSNDVELTHREIQRLSQLRHPNLVLFLGACIDLKSQQPTLLLNELMPHSLHEVLETHKATLTISEIIDIFLDISQALVYLHSQQPPIVHGHMTDKNVLLQGNRAKLADLYQGQLLKLVATENKSKAAESSALHYQPPEFQQSSGRGRGRPTPPLADKTDIFSLGVLLVQSITTQTPCTELRQNHLHAAVKSMPIFESVVHAALSTLPAERPAATEMCNDLLEIRANDRFYPLSKLSPSPESQIGVLSQRWIAAKLEESGQVLSKRIHMSYSMLQAEGRRWQDQYHRADTLEASVITLQEQVEYLSDKLMERTQAHEGALVRCSESERSLAALQESSEQQIASLREEKRALTDLVRGLEHDLHELGNNHSQISALNAELQERLKVRDDALIKARSDSRDQATQNRALQRQVEQLNEEVAELEIRLEQALVRWKKEQEAMTVAKMDFVRIRSTCANEIEKRIALEAELKATQGWLKAKEEATLPATVQDQISLLQQQLVLAAEAGERLLEQRQTIEEEHSALRAEMVTLQMTVTNLETRAEEHRAEHERQLAARDSASEKLRAELLIALETAAKKEIEAAEREEALSLRVAELLGDGGGRESGRAPSPPNLGSVDVDKKNQRRDHEDGPETMTDLLENTAQMSAGPASPGKKFSVTDLHGAAEKTDKYRKIREEGEAHRAAVAAAEARRDAEKAAKVRVTHAEAVGALALAKLLVEQWEDPNVSWRGARALRPLVNKDDNSSACLRLGVDLIAVQSLQKFPDVDMVQGQMLQLLGSLSYGSDAVRRRTGERGVLVCIKQALDAFGQNESVVLHALTALTNLSHNSPDNRHRFIEAQGMESLSATMEIHIGSSKVQRQGCWALLTLAGSDDTGKLVAQAGGGTVVINAMLSHRTEAGVQQFGLWALSNMALAGGDVTRRLRKGGCVEVCRIAIETHPGDPEVIRQARHMMSIVGPPPAPFKKK